MKVGDRTPWPKNVPYDPYLIRVAKGMRGWVDKAANSKATNSYVGQAKKLVAEREEREARDARPIEQAATFLRRAGFKPVYDRFIVLEGKEKGYQVGRRVLDDEAAVLALARTKGWGG